MREQELGTKIDVMNINFSPNFAICRHPDNMFSYANCNDFSNCLFRDIMMIERVNVSKLGEHYSFNHDHGQYISKPGEDDNTDDWTYLIHPLYGICFIFEPPKNMTPIEYVTIYLSDTSAFPSAKFGWNRNLLGRLERPRKIQNIVLTNSTGKIDIESSIYKRNVGNKTVNRGSWSETYSLTPDDPRIAKNWAQPETKQ